MSDKNFSGFPPNGPGTYTLVLRVLKSTDLSVGALGIRHFSRGFYSYTGSALGFSQNLRRRIARHLGGTKRRRWHIDYLLSNAQVQSVIYCVHHVRFECSVVHALVRRTKPVIIVPGFGSSDCTQGCRTHLFYHPELGIRELVESLKQTYHEIGCEPEIIKARKV